MALQRAAHGGRGDAVSQRGEQPGGAEEGGEVHPHLYREPGLYCYLFDKADGEPERTKEFNMPAIKKLRELYQKVKDNCHSPRGVVNEMEGICLEIGADPL